MQPIRQPVPLRCLFLLVLGVLVAGCASTGSGVRDYDRLVRALASERSDAWSELDAAFLALPDFQVRLDKLGVLHEQIGDRRSEDATAMAETMLELYYGDIRAHELRHRIALAVGDTERAAFHLAATEALANVIDTSGDGSEDTPWRVISAPQAYAWLELRRQDVVGTFYEIDDEAPTLRLVTRIRDREARRIDEARFDLTPTFRAAATLAALVAGGDPPVPSQVVATRATQGDSDAQTAYALDLWQQGPEYAARAVQWLQAASGSGNLVAREMLGVIYGSLASARTGEEAQRLLDAAVDQFLLAVNQGSATAMYNLAQLYLSGHFGEENQPAGVSLLEQAVERDNLDAAVMLARLHYNGQFVAQDRDRAIELLAGASAQGHTDAQLFYARHMLSTDEGAGFDEQAYAWLVEAAEDGASPEAMVLLGTLHADGEFAERDAPLAVSWFKQAAKQSRDAELVNSVAWILVVAEDRALRDPEAGLAFMNRLMVENAEASANPAYLDTWAAAHAANGDFESAARVQREAIAIAETETDADGQPPQYLPIIREHLELFEAGGTVSEDVP